MAHWGGCCAKNKHIYMYIGEHPQIDTSIYPFKHEAVIVILILCTLMVRR